MRKIKEIVRLKLETGLSNFLDTAIRLSELVNLKLSKVGLAGGEMVIFGKGSKERRVPIGTIDPEQAWFWSDRWQRMEREARADLEAGHIIEYANIAEALEALDENSAGNDAED